MQHLYTLASTQHNRSRAHYLSPVDPSSLPLRGVWVVTYTSLSLDSSSSSLLTTQLSAWSWRNLLPFLLGLLLSKEKPHFQPSSPSYPSVSEDPPSPRDLQRETPTILAPPQEVLPRSRSYSFAFSGEKTLTSWAEIFSKANRSNQSLQCCGIYSQQFSLNPGKKEMKLLTFNNLKRGEKKRVL